MPTRVPTVTAYADPVGIPEIAERLGVKRPTVDVWMQRAADPDTSLPPFPERDYTVGGRPAWEWATIVEWAKRTGRLPSGV